MAIPSPSRLERFLAPYACGGSLSVRVWGVEAGPARDLPLTMEGELFGGTPRLLCLGATETGLVVVRQTCDGYEDLDGSLVPWPHVARLERDPHLVRDVVTVEVRGRDPYSVAVSNHILLPGNRAAAKSLCDLARRTSEAYASSPTIDTRVAPPSPFENPRPAPDPV